MGRATAAATAREPDSLTPAQQSIVHLPTEGQFLACGAAGSGKTRVALERALHLARQPLLHGTPRVLLLARTPVLAAELRAQRDAAESPVRSSAASAHSSRDTTRGSLARAIDVDTIPAWCAARIAASEGRAPRLLTAAQSAELVHGATELVRRRRRSQVLRRPLRFFTTEIESMLLGLGVERFEEYQPVAREGRGSPLDEEARRTVFAVYEEARALARRIGAELPLALVARTIAQLARDRALPYDHVVVDDAGELAPVELQLARLLAAGGSLTLLAALEQRFDPIGRSLRELGLERLERTAPLTEVVRGTAPIVEAALAVLRRKRRAKKDGATPTATSGSIELKRIAARTSEGIAPRLLLTPTWEAELEAIGGEVERVVAAGRPLGSIAVLTSGDLSRELVAATLARRGFATWRLEEGETLFAKHSEAIALGLARESAGREFPVVLVHDVNRGAYPRLRSTLAEHEHATGDEDARRTLHLAMTRATEELVLTATEGTRSPLLPMKRLQVERRGS